MDKDKITDLLEMLEQCSRAKTLEQIERLISNLPQEFQQTFKKHYECFLDRWYCLMLSFEDWAIYLEEQNLGNLAVAIGDLMEEITWANDDMNEHQKTDLFKKILAKCEDIRLSL